MFQCLYMYVCVHVYGCVFCFEQKQLVLGPYTIGVEGYIYVSTVHV